ncbi:MAG: hypothetical protein KGP35_08365 [Bacteroidetes bacterium]|nr:hypothetical protein [Bacteroidota bacterium]
MNRFLFAVNGDPAAAIKLYQLNIQLSQNLFGNIGIFEDLNQVRKLRNRIAHHEPLCFNSDNQISTIETIKNYQIIIKYIEWLGYLPEKLFLEIDEVSRINKDIISIGRDT